MEQVAKKCISCAWGWVGGWEAVKEIVVRSRAALESRVQLTVLGVCVDSVRGLGVIG